MIAMRALLLRWILLSVAVWGAATALPDRMVALDAVWEAGLAAAVIGLLNALVRPVLFIFKLVTFPISLLTLGLFGIVVSFVMNMIVFWGVGQWLPGFRVHGIAGAAAGAAIMSAINAVLMMLAPGARRNRAR
jgi:putative membrane protein